MKLKIEIWKMRGMVIFKAVQITMGRRNGDILDLIVAFIFIGLFVVLIAIIRLVLPALIVIGIVVGIYFYVKSLLNERKDRQIKLQRCIELAPTIRKALLEFKPADNALHSYCSNTDFITWKGYYQGLFNELETVYLVQLQLPEDNKTDIENFLKYHRSNENLRTTYNEKFVKTELKRYSSFFDNIEGRCLDMQQRTALVTDEDNNLIIAGAGTGKTTTIVGKVQYLVDKYKIHPSQILVISFTNKTVEDLKDRIKVDGIQVSTFSKFGLDIVTSCEGNKKQNVFNEKELSFFIEGQIKELSKNSDYTKFLNDFFHNEKKPAKTQLDFKTQGEYFSYLKQENARPYKKKEIHYKGKVTYRRELVKSIEECRIANFLLFNGVSYEYEKPFEIDLATQEYGQWQPDFTITQGDTKVLVEHLALDRKGNVPPFFRKFGENYLDAISRYTRKRLWAQKTCADYRVPLIETFSYEMQEGTLFVNLKKNLESKGITFSPLSEVERWKIISEAAGDEVEAFVELIGIFIGHLKSNNYTIDELLKKNKQEKNAYQRNRNALFLSIVKPIFESYQQKLKNDKQVDFNDMINHASKQIEDKKYLVNYRYLIVDEYQDISMGRYRLLKAIREQSKGCKVFCVGDDWQSIYRFTGSDIALFKNFEKYFGVTIKTNIETTYRFNEPLIGFSSSFILKNPNQTRKELKGFVKNATTNYQVVYSETDSGDDTDALREIFDQLILKYEGIENKTIYILGRYSFDLKNRIKNESRVFRIFSSNEKLEYSAVNKKGKSILISVSYLTVHKAKGLEADIVIVLNCNSGKYGFPSEIVDDPVLNLVLTEADQFENGEERRLFYVAMTRARENVFFIADKIYKSKFIIEIDGSNQSAKKCPICKTSDMVLRTSKATGKKFYGCINYTYGCDYTEKLN